MRDPAGLLQAAHACSNGGGGSGTSSSINLKRLLMSKYLGIDIQRIDRYLALFSAYPVWSLTALPVAPVWYLRAERRGRQEGTR
jgi:hypothetical protein